MPRILTAVALALCFAGMVAYVSVGRHRRSPSAVVHTLALVLLLAAIVMHSIQTGRPPFATTQEFASVFAWGVIAIGLGFAYRRERSVIWVSVPSLAIAAALLTWVVVDYPRVQNLMPALQNDPLFISHVGVAALAYGAFAVAFGAAVGRLCVRAKAPPKAQSRAGLMDTICYRAVRVGFPLFTLALLLGSIWADVAWGSFWSWDPKETASLLTWLVFATYLHARVLRGWTGRRPSLIVVVGFIAVVATFLGNFVFSGLHAYN
jgi:cytochrome c-type biogenesis protein CcsB